MILIAFGTRPEYIKLKPVMDIFDKEKHLYKVLFTGQHSDLLPKGAKDRIDISLKIDGGDNRLDSIVQSVMNKEEVFKNIDFVMVQGDTTSAFSMALASFHRKIPVIHLEAGLRTYDNDNPYPEEFNRQAISRIASIHLCPTASDYQNLFNEKAQGSKYVVGNTVLDNLRNLEVSYNNDVLITMHRRENHDKMKQWFIAFENAAEKFPEKNFIFIAHPNPNVQKHVGSLKRTKVIDPVPYDEFIKKVAGCCFLITDSGGLQEESSFLRKKSIVCRHKTERTSGIGIFSKMCGHPEDLNRLVLNVVSEPTVSKSQVCPYGDGRSAEKIYDIIKGVY